MIYEIFNTFDKIFIRFLFTNNLLRNFDLNNLFLKKLTLRSDVTAGSTLLQGHEKTTTCNIGYSREALDKYRLYYAHRPDETA